MIEFPHTHMDRRPRKRQRLGWDVAPQTLKVSDLIFEDSLYKSVFFGSVC